LPRSSSLLLLATQQRYYKQDQKDYHQHFGNPRGRPREAPETEHPGDDRDDQENKGIPEHKKALFPLRGAFLDLALVSEVSAMGAFVGLNVFKPAARIANGIEFLAFAASMSCASGFSWHGVPLVFVLAFSVVINHLCQ
jgi:hypothetical protein